MLPSPSARATALTSTRSVALRPPARRAPTPAARAWLAGRQVVADDELAVRVDPGDELLELERQQPAVGAELEHVVLDLAGDPGHHLEPLRDDGDVAHGDEVLDLEGRQRAGHLVEPHLVALEGGQRLVGPGQDRAGVLEHVAGLADVEGDDLHRLRHRDDRVARHPGDPVGGAVPGAGLLEWIDGSGMRWTAARRMRVASLSRTIAPSILASSRSPVAENGHVEGEAAGGDGVDGPVGAEDDEGAGAAAQDPLEAVAQRRAGGDVGQVARRRRPSSGRSGGATGLLGSRTYVGRRSSRGRQRRRDGGDRARRAARPAGAARRSGAAATSRPSTRRVPTSPGSAGTRASLKPIRAASASRRSSSGTRRSSPARPISPIAITSGGTVNPGRRRRPPARSRGRRRAR